MAALEKMNLLIIDEYPLLIEGLKEMLIKEVWISTIHSSDNLVDALKILSVHKVDCIVLDINIPEIEGIINGKPGIADSIKCPIIFREQNLIRLQEFYGFNINGIHNSGIKLLCYDLMGC